MRQIRVCHQRGEEIAACVGKADADVACDGDSAPRSAEESPQLGDPFYATTTWLEMPAPRMLVRLACLWEKVPAKAKLSTASWAHALRESRKQVRFTQSSGSAADWLAEVQQETMRKILATQAQITFNAFPPCRRVLSSTFLPVGTQLPSSPNMTIQRPFPKTLPNTILPVMGPSHQFPIGKPSLD